MECFPDKKKIWALIVGTLVFSLVLFSIIEHDGFGAKQLVLVYRDPPIDAGINRSVSQMMRDKNPLASAEYPGISLDQSGSSPDTFETGHPNTLVADISTATLQLTELKQAGIETTSTMVDDTFNSDSTVILPPKTTAATTEKPPIEHCTLLPITKLVFIKTHKTGSTTMATIFERFGHHKNLLFALPKGNHIFSPRNLPFSRKYVIPLPKSLALKRRSFDILDNHAVYNRKELDAVVPNAKYITILRDPVYQLESAFGYFEMARGMGLSKQPNPFEAFMKDPLFYYTNKTYNSKYASRNSQLYDLGIFPNAYGNVSNLQKKIEQIDKEFDLVLITEYYDESLVLLKQSLCWTYDDIIYIPKGTRSQSHRYKISENVQQQIRRWNDGDVLLYEHFNRTFWNKVATYGDDFEADLAEFRRLKQAAMDKCVAADKYDNHDRRAHDFILNKDETGNEYCADLMRSDVPYTALLKKKMRELVMPKAVPAKPRIGVPVIGKRRPQ